MKNSSQQYLIQLIQRYPGLKPEFPRLLKATDLIIESYKNKGKLLICGNGGSASDSQHIVGELMKGFKLTRQIDDRLISSLKTSFPEDGEYIGENLQKSLPAISLVSETSLMTAFSNDKEADLCFAQQVLGYGKKGDVLLGISTSGNSSNVFYAMEVAKEIGLTTIGLTGAHDSKISSLAEVTIKADETETYKIQERHLPIYHAICLALEEEFFGND